MAPPPGKRGGGGGARGVGAAAAATHPHPHPSPPPGAAHVDGSQLEGGGQILRNAAAIAAITRRAVHVDRIRAGRRVPGLSPQHLTGLTLVADMCGGELSGGAVRSTAVALAPGRPVRCGEYSADTRTAGSCTLMVQQALPVCVFAAAASASASASASAQDDGGGDGGGSGWTRLELRGGTDAAHAPCVGYLRSVLAPALRSLLGVEAEVAVLRRGFYPRGGGAIQVRARALPRGASLPAFDATARGRLRSVRAEAFSAGRVPQEDARRMASAAVEALQDALAGPTGPAIVHGSSSSSNGSSGGGGGSGGSGVGGVDIRQEVVREGESTATGDGGGLLLVAESDTGRLWGSSALWERGVPPGAAGRAAAEELLGALRSGACVDEWLEDQLIVWMALARGTSRLVTRAPTLHTRTAIAVASQLLPGARFKVTPLAGGGGDGGGGGAADECLHLIECEGAGVTAG